MHKCFINLPTAAHTARGVQAERIHLEAPHRWGISYLCMVRLDFMWIHQHSIALVVSDASSYAAEALFSFSPSTSRSSRLSRIAAETLRFTIKATVVVTLTARGVKSKRGLQVMSIAKQNPMFQVLCDLSFSKHRISHYLFVLA